MGVFRPSLAWQLLQLRPLPWNSFNHLGDTCNTRTQLHMHSNRQTLACQSVSRASPHRMLHPHPHPHPHSIHFTSPPIALPLGSNVYLPCFGQLRFHVGALWHLACGRLAGNPLSRSPGGVATKTRPSGAQGFHRKSRAEHKKSTHNMLFH